MQARVKVSLKATKTNQGFTNPERESRLIILQATENRKPVERKEMLTEIPEMAGQILAVVTDLEICLLHWRKV